MRATFSQTRLIFTVLLVALLATPMIAAAQPAVPSYLTHQGRVFGADNLPLSGAQTMTFRVYDTGDDAGVALWEETLDVAMSNGFYSVMLGQTAALPDTVFDGSTRYLGVTIGDAAAPDELAPRLEVASVAYALRAGEADNATGALTPTSVTVGGAQIDVDGTITLGAATVNTDGSIVVGNTTINPDGSISVSGNPVIGSDGAVDAGAFSGTTLSDLEVSGCATGQLPQFNAATGWSCITPAAGTAYAAGAGLTLDATDTFSVDPTQVQTRLSGACNPGEFMLGANEDGSVNCALDHVYSGGSGVVVTTVGDSSTVAVDFGVAQQRVSGTCTGGDKITAINADGTVACSPDIDTDTTYAAGAGVDITGGTISLIDAVDDDTTYTAGAGVDITGTTISLLDPTDDDTTYNAGIGLTLSGTTFNVDSSAVQTRVTGVCAAGEKLLGVNVDGSVSCAADADTDTTYSAGTGIAIAGTTISLVDPTDDDTQYAAGTGLTLDASNAFNVNPTLVQTRVGGPCGAGEYIQAIAQDGTPACVADADTVLDEATVDGFVSNNGYALAVDTLTKAAFNDGFAWANSTSQFSFTEGGWRAMSNFGALNIRTTGNPVFVHTSIQMNDDVGLNGGSPTGGEWIGMACLVNVDGMDYLLGQHEYYARYNFEWTYTYSGVIPIPAGDHVVTLVCRQDRAAANNMNSNVGNRGFESPMITPPGSNGSFQDVLMLMELGRQ